MTAIDRKPRKKNPIEQIMIHLSGAVALVFAGWMTYHFVRLALVGLQLVFP